MVSNRRGRGGGGYFIRFDDNEREVNSTKPFS